MTGWAVGAVAKAAAAPGEEEVEHNAMTNGDPKPWRLYLCKATLPAEPLLAQQRGRAISNWPDLLVDGQENVHDFEEASPDDEALRPEGACPVSHGAEQ